MIPRCGSLWTPTTCEWLQIMLLSHLVPDLFIPTKMIGVGLFDEKARVAGVIMRSQSGNPPIQCQQPHHQSARRRLRSRRRASRPDSRSARCVLYVPLPAGNVVDMYKLIALELGLPTERNRAATPSASEFEAIPQEAMKPDLGELFPGAAKMSCSRRK